MAPTGLRLPDAVIEAFAAYWQTSFFTPLLRLDCNFEDQSGLAALPLWPRAFELTTS